MRKLSLNIILGLLVAVTAQASKKSFWTGVIESLSSSTVVKVECSMEDFTCQKLIVLEAGRREGLELYKEGKIELLNTTKTDELSDYLKTSLSFLRDKYPTLNSRSNADVLCVLNKVLQNDSLLQNVFVDENTLKKDVVIVMCGGSAISL